MKYENIFVKTGIYFFRFAPYKNNFKHTIMKRKITIYGILFLMIASSISNAQPLTVYSSGFSNLIGISRDASGHIFVAEAGSVNNDSKISVITPSAMVYPLITGLPSFLDTLNGEVAGAWRAEMLANYQLMVVVGGGVISLR